MTNFKGIGEHSVFELEKIILEQQELLHQKQIAGQKMKATLEVIQKWEMPSTGLFWDKEEKEPMSYAAAYGSNGERDYIKSITTLVLSNVGSFF